jgi:hypothetical protein
MAKLFLVAQVRLLLPRRYSAWALCRQRRDRVGSDGIGRGWWGGWSPPAGRLLQAPRGYAGNPDARQAVYEAIARLHARSLIARKVEESSGNIISSHDGDTKSSV